MQPAEAKSVATRHAPIPLDRFVFSRQKEASWVPAGGLLVRDSLLGEVSAGQIDALFLKADAAGAVDHFTTETPPHYHFVLMLKGSLTLTRKDGALLTLSQFDGAHQPALADIQSATVSDDFSALEIRAPGRSLGSAAFDPLFDFPKRVVDPEQAIVRNVSENWVVGAGLREWLAYCDFNTEALTEGAIHNLHARVTRPISGGSGWHTHSMSQFFLCTGGWGLLRFGEGIGELRLTSGDAVIMPPGLPHDLYELSGDYSGFEMCLPAKYDTVFIEEPTDAA